MASSSSLGASHIRDRVDHLIIEGFSEEQAFKKAIAEFGEPEAVGLELRWMVSVNNSWHAGQVVEAHLSGIEEVVRITPGRATLVKGDQEIFEKNLAVTSGNFCLFLIGVGHFIRTSSQNLPAHPNCYLDSLFNCCSLSGIECFPPQSGKCVAIRMRKVVGRIS